jgi:hypothetical protein
MDSITHLILVLRYAERAGITLPDGFVEDFESEEAATLFLRMKMAFHVAASISPLVILIPTRWSNMNLSRGHLLTVCRTLCFTRI